MAKALTAAAVDRFKANPEKRQEIPDGLLSGLYLVVQPSGAKSWAVRYRYAGKPCKLTVGSYPAFDLAAARREAKEALQQVQLGADPAQIKLAQRRAHAAEDDFRSVAALWVNKAQRPRRRSWQPTARFLGLVPDSKDPQRLNTLKGSLVDRWGDRKISDITRADIIAALDKIHDRAPIVANRTLAHLRALFNWAVSRDLIALNPCAGVKPPAEERSRDRLLSDDELKRIWNAAGTIGWPFGPIVRLLILTGQRREEVAGMRWGELGLDRGLWTLPRGRVKNDTGHEVPLSGPAIEILRGLHRVRDSDLVFTTTGDHRVSGFSKAKDRITAAAGVQDWRLHDLRRKAASGMARLGISLPVIEKILNHSSGSFAGVVGVYQRHSFSDEKRAALETWARFVMSLVEGKPLNVVQLAQVRA